MGLEKIKKCKEIHRVSSCGECPLVLGCFLIDETLSSKGVSAPNKKRD